jgi:DNA-binding transcriptional ArsR family regulator
MTIIRLDGADLIAFSVVTGTSIQALAQLSAIAASGDADGELAKALDEIGDRSGETWLHLLCLCVDIGPPRSLDNLLDHVSGMDARWFRLVLLGIGAWSWRSIVGADVIEAAAHGDESAAEILLSDERYYGRSARAALSKILPLSPTETQRRFVDALEAFRDTVDVEHLSASLDQVAARIDALADTEGWWETIEILTGYRYVAEPEALRVVVMSHLAGPGLVLAQHEDTRLIVFGNTPPGTPAERVVSLGKAISDPTRVQLLTLIRDRPSQLGELVDATGLTRSTVHHHLRLLREAGLVSVEGNARSYRYGINQRGRSDVSTLLTELLGTREQIGASQ